MCLERTGIGRDWTWLAVMSTRVQGSMRDRLSDGARSAIRGLAIRGLAIRGLAIRGLAIRGLAGQV